MIDQLLTQPMEHPQESCTVLGADPPSDHAPKTVRSLPEDQLRAIGGRLRAILASQGHGAADAEDLVQLAFFKALERGVGGRVEAYLHKVVRTRGLTLIQRSCDRKENLREWASRRQAPSSVDPAAEYERKEMVQAVRDAVTRLEPRLRMVARLWLAGRSHAEIAAIIGASESTSQRLLAEARGILKEALGGWR